MPNSGGIACITPSISIHAKLVQGGSETDCDYF
jgi:hypothetical protein